RVQRVKVVHNELTVGPRLSLLARNNDALITSSAKTRMLADSTIPGRRIKVVTEAGAVYLMGLVTRAEADAAVAAVQQVGGVQRTCATPQRPSGHPGVERCPTPLIVIPAT